MAEDPKANMSPFTSVLSKAAFPTPDAPTPNRPSAEITRKTAIVWDSYFANPAPTQLPDMFKLSVPTTYLKRKLYVAVQVTGGGSFDGELMFYKGSSFLHKLPISAIFGATTNDAKSACSISSISPTASADCLVVWPPLAAAGIFSSAGPFAISPQHVDSDADLIVPVGQIRGSINALWVFVAVLSQSA